MAERFCREHGMHHETELRDPDCEFEDANGEVIDPADFDPDDDPGDIPGFEGTREALASLRVSPNTEEKS